MTMAVDAHVHLWDRALDPQDWIDPQTMAPIDRDFGPYDLSAMLAVTGPERAIVVQSGNRLEESIRLAQLDPSVVAGLVGWVDLTAEAGPQRERICRNAAVPLVGVRHLAHIRPGPRVAAAGRHFPRPGHARSRRPLLRPRRAVVATPTGGTVERSSRRASLRTRPSGRSGRPRRGCERLGSRPARARSSLERGREGLGPHLRSGSGILAGRGSRRPGVDRPGGVRA